MSHPARVALLFCLAAACGRTSKHEGEKQAPAAPTAPAPGAGRASAAPPDAKPAAPPATPVDAAAGAASDQARADLLTAETTAYERARPVFEEHCARCHAEGRKKVSPKKLAHFDMTTYPFGGHHVGTMAKTIRHVLGIDGARPSMPADKKGAVAGDARALVAAWADAWDAAANGGAHDGLAAYEPPADAAADD